MTRKIHPGVSKSMAIGLFVSLASGNRRGLGLTDEGIVVQPLWRFRRSGYGGAAPLIVGQHIFARAS